MKPKGIVFDFDQTLYNLKVDWSSLKKDLSEYFKEFGYHSTFHPLYPELYKALTFVESRFSEREKNISKKWAYNTIKNAEIRGLKGGESFSGVGSLLESLDRMGIMIGIVSSNSKKVVEMAIKDNKWPKIKLVGREDVDNLKPSPEGVLLCLRKLKLCSKEIWGVGDSDMDQIAFRKARLHKTFLVERGEKSKYSDVVTLTKTTKLMSWIT